jgi:hypothetical protein
VNAINIDTLPATSSLDEHLDDVLAVLDALLQDGAIVRCVLDFDADHVCLVTTEFPRRLRIRSVERLLANARRDTSQQVNGQSGNPLTEAASLALADIAIMRHATGPRRLHQACVDLERGLTTRRFADGRIRRLTLDTASAPPDLLAS